MTTANTTEKKNPRNGRKLIAAAAALALVALFLFFAISKYTKNLSLKPAKGPPAAGAQIEKNDTGSTAPAHAPDTMHKGTERRLNDTAGRAMTRRSNASPVRRQLPLGKSAETGGRSPADTGKNIAVPMTGKDTAQGKNSGTTDSTGTAHAPAEDTVIDTTRNASTVAAGGATAEPCGSDTFALYVYPEPSGGLHRGKIAVAFHANKPCTISWQIEPDTAWRAWSGEPIAIDRTTTLCFTAVDKCGHAMRTRKEYYEIGKAIPTTLCPGDMELVEIGSTRFCVDRYEWPNRKGVVPLAYVSLYEAKDSCFAAGKRLCTSEEWSLACSGPYSWNYPYGQEYERYACVTHDTTARPSGSKPECRAFFGAFDMAGNLLEWTSTPAKDDRKFNNVMGGFWQSGPRSGCFDIRYSYFPQNRHNPVGFRCCKSIPQGTE